MAIAFPLVFFMEFVRSEFTELPGLHLVIYGVLMIVVMIYYPAGFAGLYYAVKNKIRAAFSRDKTEPQGA